MPPLRVFLAFYKLYLYSSMFPDLPFLPAYVRMMEPGGAGGLALSAPGKLPP
jgi:hypothetical protein